VIDKIVLIESDRVPQFKAGYGFSTPNYECLPHSAHSENKGSHVANIYINNCC